MEKRMMNSRKITAICLAIAMATIFSAPTSTIDPTGRAAFYTDYHGSMAVSHAFKSVAKHDEKYKEQWKMSLDWLVAQAQEDREGLKWMWCVNPPENHQTWRPRAFK